MFAGFILHIYIIFGTNLLTGDPAQIAVFFSYFTVSKKRNIKQSPNGMKPSGAWFFGRIWSGRLGVHVRRSSRRPRDRRVRPTGVGTPPPSWAPRCSTDVLPSPIYIHVHRKHPGEPRKTISTAATFCIREIPSWSHRRCSAGGGIDHGGPLDHLQVLSDDLWVVYHRPSGP